MKKNLLRIILALVAFLPTFSAQANTQDFQSWLNNFKAEAMQKGISATTLERSFTSVQPQDRIIELDRKQPEGKFTFAQYKQRVITQDRIDKGRRLYRENRSLLNRISQQYGVQPQYIVALWGIETSYGSFTGGYGVIEALATLAYDGRRSDFFRGELIDALKIIQAGHIAPEEMKGSWAGAMGQNQFMPSSFHSFAADGNGDGHRDIWNTLPDVFASTANYLSTSGWKGDERWGRKVKLPSNFSEKLLGREVRRSILDWKSLGVTKPNGQPLPHVPGMRASIVAPDGVGGDAYIVYDNYNVIMKWNRSTYFATSVGILADLIAIGG